MREVVGLRSEGCLNELHASTWTRRRDLKPAVSPLLKRPRAGATFATVTTSARQQRPPMPRPARPRKRRVSILGSKIARRRGHSVPPEGRIDGRRGAAAAKLLQSRSPADRGSSAKFKAEPIDVRASAASVLESTGPARSVTRCRTAASSRSFRPTCRRGPTLPDDGEIARGGIRCRPTYRRRGTGKAMRDDFRDADMACRSSAEPLRSHIRDAEFADDRPLQHASQGDTLCPARRYADPRSALASSISADRLRPPTRTPRASTATPNRDGRPALFEVQVMDWGWRGHRGRVDLYFWG